MACCVICQIPAVLAVDVLGGGLGAAADHIEADLAGAIEGEDAGF